MRLDRLNLNLFVVFEAIYAERNLTRAAEVLNVTQPALSNALRRLRDMFDDKLFVRGPRGMSPTPVAENVIGRVRRALQLLDSSVNERDQFIPASSERTFGIAMGDMAEALFLPQLLADLAELSPKIALRSFVVPRSEIPLELANYSVDLAIEPPLLGGDHVSSIPLLTDNYVCALRRGHPMSKKQLTLDHYLTMAHLHLSSRRRGMGQVDLALLGLGKRRRITMRVQHYMVGSWIIENTDLAMTIPSALANMMGLPSYALPFEVQPLQLHLFWHRNRENDPANRWLRHLLIAHRPST